MLINIFLGSLYLLLSGIIFIVIKVIALRSYHRQIRKGKSDPLIFLDNAWKRGSGKIELGESYMVVAFLTPLFWPVVLPLFLVGYIIYKIVKTLSKLVNSIVNYMVKLDELVETK